MTLPQPLITPDKKHGYVLAQAYTYEWIKEGKRFRLTVPEGEPTDGASVPRALWSIIPPDGLHRAAAIPHDFLFARQGGKRKPLPPGSYQVHTKEGWKDVADVYGPEAAIWTRKEADRLFGRMLREAGVGMFQRRAMYRAVRTFGWIWWRT